MFAKIRHLATYTENHDREAQFYKEILGSRKLRMGSPMKQAASIPTGDILMTESLESRWFSVIRVHIRGWISSVCWWKT